MKKDSDSISRFLFEQAAVRGEIVHLDATWQTVMAQHDYPPVLRRAMGELMAAAALLAATLKLQGSLILQIQGQGAISLLVVECAAEGTMRATAKWSEDIIDTDFIELVGDGRFAITLMNAEGQQNYQGIVPLEGRTVAEILENYMLRSEQLDTRLWLAANSETAAGLLLQKLPDQPQMDEDMWDRASHLAATVTETELLQLPASTLLHRLFSEENVRLFEPQSISFYCSCSLDNVANMLRMLGQEEIHSILDEREEIEIHCDFCNRRYAFDRIDTEQIFATQVIPPSSPTRH